MSEKTDPVTTAAVNAFLSPKAAWVFVLVGGAMVAASKIEYAAIQPVAESLANYGDFLLIAVGFRGALKK